MPKEKFTRTTPMGAVPYVPPDTTKIPVIDAAVPPPQEGRRPAVPAQQTPYPGQPGAQQGYTGQIPVVQQGYTGAFPPVQPQVPYGQTPPNYGAMSPMQQYTGQIPIVQPGAGVTPSMQQGYATGVVPTVQPGYATGMVPTVQQGYVPPGQAQNLQQRYTGQVPILYQESQPGTSPDSYRKAPIARPIEPQQQQSMPPFPPPPPNAMQYTQPIQGVPTYIDPNMHPGQVPPGIVNPFGPIEQTKKEKPAPFLDGLKRIPVAAWVILVGILLAVLLIWLLYYNPIARADALAPPSPDPAMYASAFVAQPTDQDDLPNLAYDPNAIPMGWHARPGSSFAPGGTASRTPAELYAGMLILVNQWTAIPNMMPDYTPTSVSNGTEGRMGVEDRNVRLRSEPLNALNLLIQDALARGHDHFIARSAARSHQDQTKLFNERLERYKKSGYTDQKAYDRTKAAIAEPGYSEHETGLAFHIGLYDKNDPKLLSTPFEETTQSVYIRNFSWRFGWILRYPPNKSKITGITNEPWHMRFVGIAHAATMQALGYCLEEYLDYLHENPIVEVYENQQLRYVILTQPMSDGAEFITATLPQNTQNWSASADNLGYAVFACTIAP